MSAFFISITDHPDGSLSIHSANSQEITKEKGPQTPAENLGITLLKVLAAAMEKHKQENEKEYEEITAV